MATAIAISEICPVTRSPSRNSAIVPEDPLQDSHGSGAGQARPTARQLSLNLRTSAASERMMTK